MDDILAKLSDIEQTASSIIDDANEEKKKLDAEMEIKTKNLDNEIGNKTKEKIEILQQQIEKEIGSKIEADKALASSILNALTEDYDKNHKLHVDELFNQMIKE